MTTIAEPPRGKLRRPSVIGAISLHRALCIVTLAVLVVGATLTAGPVRAHDEPLIQPGAPVRLSVSALGQFNPCTLNFVFRDRRHTYIGSTARCAQTVGERATMADREFGTVVYRALTISTLEESVTHTQSIDDFALIRVDASEVHRVSPVVMDVGRSPHGVTTADQTNQGDVVFMTGQGAGFRQGGIRHRVGVLTSDDERGFHIAIPASLGDGGAPVLDINFNAYGVLASSANANGPYGTTIERVLQLLDEAGFDVELVTAYDSSVSSSGMGPNG